MSTHSSALPSPAPRARRRPLVIGRLTPNWFAAVMGTAIVANAAHALPGGRRSLEIPATVVWLAATALLLVLATAWAMQLVRARGAVRQMVALPAVAQFFAAPPLAVLSVGAGFALYGPDVVGDRAALAASAALWVLGTVAGIVVTVGLPYLTFTRYAVAQEDVNPTWLLPIVPPMLSASTGAILIPHVGDLSLRADVLLADYLLLGASTLAAAVVMVLVWSRLAFAGVGPAQLVPALWLGLGPIGTSVTAAVGLGHAAESALPSHAGALQAAALVYGLVAVGFALLWLAIALLITASTARAGLPFAMTWWAFTFPVGVLSTAAGDLAQVTDSSLLAGVGVALYALLVVGWLAAAPRTLRGALDGTLLAPLPATPASAVPQASAAPLLTAQAAAAPAAPAAAAQAAAPPEPSAAASHARRRPADRLCAAPATPC